MLFRMQMSGMCLGGVGGIEVGKKIATLAAVNYARMTQSDFAADR